MSVISLCNVSCRYENLEQWILTAVAPMILSIISLSLAASTIFVASSTKLAAVVEGADKAVTWRHYAALALFYSSFSFAKFQIRTYRPVSTRKNPHDRKIGFHQEN
jgi:hypothetical protein